MSPAAATATTTTTAAPAADIMVYARKTSKTKLTTAFAAPTSCKDAYLRVSTFTSTPSSSSFGKRQSITEWQVHRSSEDGCQPFGADNNLQRTSFYDVAVCPSDWTAYNLGAVTSWRVKAKDVYFTADCCPSGFNTTAEVPGGEYGTWCAQPVSPNTTVTAYQHQSTGQVTITSALRYASVWGITWKQSDVSTLNPRPPALTPTCTNTQLSSWVPGSSVPTFVPCREYQRREGDPDESLDRIFEFLVIGLPIIVFALIVSCCVCCCVSRRRKRRRQTKGPEGYSTDYAVGLSPAEQREAIELQTIARPPPAERGVSAAAAAAAEPETVKETTARVNLSTNETRASNV